MDEKVIAYLREGVALDLYQSVKAARKLKDQKVFRHTMLDENGTSVFVGFFPKAELDELPDLDQSFRERLKIFNAIGVITDGETRLDMYVLGSMNKPFTTLQSHNELMKQLDDGPLSAFMEQYFEVRGVNIDFMNMEYEAFMEAVEREVFANTPMSEMSKLEELFKN